MKKIIILLTAYIFYNSPIFAQIDLIKLLDSTNWDSTETELILKFQNNIERTKHEEWKEENSISDYQFKNIKLNGITISKAPIRVNTETRKIFRINFFVFRDCKDEKMKNNMDVYLTKLFGKPYSATNDIGSVITRNETSWSKNHYKIEASCITYKDTYDYIVSVEPLSYYPVKYTEAIAEHNPSNSPVPQILHFKVDNNENIIIKEAGKTEKVYKKTKKMPTPKGDVISFEGGMFCYREQNSDIIYMTQGLAIRYPVDKEKLKK